VPLPSKYGLIIPKSVGLHRDSPIGTRESRPSKYVGKDLWKWWVLDQSQKAEGVIDGKSEDN